MSLALHYAIWQYVLTLIRRIEGYTGLRACVESTHKFSVESTHKFSVESTHPQGT